MSYSFIRTISFRGGSRGCDRMVVEITTTCAITTSVGRSNPARARVLDTTLYDTVCQWLAAGWWFSPGTLLSSISKTPDLFFFCPNS